MQSEMEQEKRQWFKAAGGSSWKSLRRRNCHDHDMEWDHDDVSEEKEDLV